jgi:hypothetical protein
MSKCKVIFRDEELKQDIVIDCELDDENTLSAKMSFDPPADKNTDLGKLSGTLAHAFYKMLKDGEA